LSLLNSNFSSNAPMHDKETNVIHQDEGMIYLSSSPFKIIIVVTYSNNIKFLSTIVKMCAYVYVCEVLF